MKSTYRRRTVAVSLVACLTFLTSCGSDETQPATLPPDSPGGGPTSTTSSRPTEPTTDAPTKREEAIARAEQAIRDYYRVTDQMAADPGVPLAALKPVARDPALSEARDYWANFRQQGFTSSRGETTFEWLKATRVDLLSEKNQGSVTIEVCYNLDGIETLDKQGEPVKAVSPALAIYQVYNYDYPSETGWIVAVENSSGEECQP